MKATLLRVGTTPITLDTKVPINTTAGRSGQLSEVMVDVGHQLDRSVHHASDSKRKRV